MPITINPSKIQINPKSALNIKNWLATSGGVFVWSSSDPSSLCQTVTTPATTVDGKPATKPGWQFADKPEHVTDIERYEVVVDKILKSFKVGVRAGRGMNLEVTGSGSRRIRNEVQKAGAGAYYLFDYNAEKNCIILVPEKVVPLSEYDPTAPGFEIIAS